MSDWRDLSALLAPVRGRLLGAGALQALAALCGVLPYIAMAQLGALLLASDVDAGRAWNVLWLALAALCLRQLTTALGLHLTHLADADLQCQLRLRLARHLSRVPLGWYAGSNAAKVNEIVQRDVAALHRLVAHAPSDLAAVVVAPMACLAWLLHTDWRMTAVTLVAPALAWWRYRGMAAPAFREGQAQLQRTGGELAAAMVELVQGMAVFKTYAQEALPQARFHAVAARHARQFLAWVRRWGGMGALVDVLLSPPVVLAFVVSGAWLGAQTGAMAPAQMLPFALLGMALCAPVAALGHGADDLKGGLAAAHRIGALLAEAPMPQAATSLLPAGDDVRYEQVRFAYPGSADVLHGIDLCLPAGSVTALVGPSGGGKSTLAMLLPRLWDVTAGAVRIGGVDVRQIDPAMLYARVGFVLQHTQVLRLSVRDNIRLGRPEASDVQVEAAARAAHIHARIMALPQGYDTLLGEGVALSGGEAQRLAIARTLLADPRIVVLDEAMAALDPESEAQVQAGLSALLAGRTVLVVAHRLQTIVQADQIVLLDGGRIGERGTHAQLLAARGMYAALWAAQSRVDEVAP